MTMRTRKSAQLGDVVAAAFDEAGRFSKDPREISRLATEAVRHLVRRAHGPLVARPPAWA